MAIHYRFPRAMFLAAAFLFLLMLLGGASRADAMTQAFVRATAIIAIAALLFDRPHEIKPDCPTLLWLLIGWTGLMAVQLVPLPPTLWTSLPGRDVLLRFYDIMDLPLPWRPITMQTEATLNSLAAMLVPWAAFLIAVRTREAPSVGELAILAFLALSVALGVLQMTGGGRSFYLYGITNFGSPVGLFSNRNHNAFMVVLALPLLASMLSRQTILSGQRLNTPVLAAIATGGFAVLVNVLVIGSRMGLLLFVLACVATLALLRPGLHARLFTRGKSRGMDKRTRAARLATPLVVSIIAAVVVIAAAATFLLLFSDRFVALSRIAGGQGEESRVQFFGPVLALVGKYFPFGSGFGTFPIMFRIDEPDELLRLSYLNHAHNDVLEIGVEGGLAAIALACAFLAFWAKRGRDAWAGGGPLSPRNFQARVGSVVSGLLLLASTTDYPLRTPACAAVFAVGCYWLFRRGDTAKVV